MHGRRSFSESAPAETLYLGSLPSGAYVVVTQGITGRFVLPVMITH
jgi:hypothetical protein